MYAMAARWRSRLRTGYGKGVREQGTEPGTLVTGHLSPRKSQWADTAGRPDSRYKPGTWVTHESKHIGNVFGDPCREKGGLAGLDGLSSTLLHPKGESPREKRIL